MEGKERFKHIKKQFTHTITSLKDRLLDVAGVIIPKEKEIREQFERADEPTTAKDKRTYKIKVDKKVIICGAPHIDPVIEERRVKGYVITPVALNLFMDEFLDLVLTERENMIVDSENLTDEHAKNNIRKNESTPTLCLLTYYIDSYDKIYPMENQIANMLAKDGVQFSVSQYDKIIMKSTAAFLYELALLYVSLKIMDHKPSMGINFIISSVLMHLLTLNTNQQPLCISKLKDIIEKVKIEEMEKLEQKREQKAKKEAQQQEQQEMNSLQQYDTNENTEDNDETDE